MQMAVRTGVLLAGTATALYWGARRAWRIRRHLQTRRHPGFVYREAQTNDLGIPVFTYHSIAAPDVPDSVTPEAFDQHMRYLSENGYYTLNADELHNCLVQGKPASQCVVITFDDGRASLWTVGYPILRKYNLRAVAFVVPQAMRAAGVRSTLSDSEAHKPEWLANLLRGDLGDNPYITWDEASLMHISGLVDVQSHTLDHALIPCAPKIIDFIHPGFRYGYSNYAVPVMRYDGIDKIFQKAPLGTPIYRNQSRMSAARRFFDDEGLRQACADFVTNLGQDEFFAKRDWRETLFEFVEQYRQDHVLDEKFETEEEQAKAIRTSLSESKRLIEEHLPGHTVRHLCYPWHRYSGLAMSLAREAGYMSAFIDINPQKPVPRWNDPYVVQQALPINEFGDDPYQITRIDAGEDAILSLPGKGRLTYAQRLFFGFLGLSHRIRRLTYANIGIN